jgi:hypothetical protein
MSPIYTTGLRRCKANSQKSRPWRRQFLEVRCDRTTQDHKTSLNVWGLKSEQQLLSTVR